MSETETQKKIAELHREYERLTGFRVALMGREWTWFEWIKRELGIEDLRMLVKEKQRRVRNGEIKPQGLMFRYLIGNVDVAEEDILLLRAAARTPRVCAGRAEVLRSTGRDAAAPTAEVKTAAAVVAKVTSDPVAAQKALEELRKFKNSL